MSHIVLVEPVTITSITVEPEDILEQMNHNAIGLLHLDLLMTLSTRKILGCFIIFCDISLQRGELNQTILAGTSPALGALKDVGKHEHAYWTLKVLGLNTQASILMEVFLRHAVLLMFVVISLHHFNTFFFSVLNYY